MKKHIPMSSPKFEPLDFERIVQEALPFIKELGFSVIESSPRLVRFKNGDIEIEAYYESLSCEVGLGIIYCGVRYSLSDVIRPIDPTAAKAFRDVTATTQEDLEAGIKLAGQALLLYGGPVIRGDFGSREALEIQRKEWAEEYALDVLTNQLRPAAEEAFRNGDYLKAVDLYNRFYPRLSSSEEKKFVIAKERSRS